MTKTRTITASSTPTDIDVREDVTRTLDGITSTNKLYPYGIKVKVGTNDILFDYFVENDYTKNFSDGMVLYANQEYAIDNIEYPVAEIRITDNTSSSTVEVSLFRFATKR